MHLKFGIKFFFHNSFSGPSLDHWFCTHINYNYFNFLCCFKFYFAVYFSLSCKRILLWFICLVVFILWRMWKKVLIFVDYTRSLMRTWTWTFFVHWLINCWKSIDLSLDSFLCSSELASGICIDRHYNTNTDTSWTLLRL